MLYDNAQLLTCYTQANVILNNEFFNSIICQTADFVLRELTNQNAGFFSSLDADSEHVEGKYYYWELDEIKNLLTNQEYQIAAEYFNFSTTPNFEQHWHLHIAKDANQLALQNHCSISEIETITQSIKLKLFNACLKRIRPGLDDKILTAWNALMIKGLALAGLQMKKPEYIECALKNIDFIKQHLWKNKRLMAAYRNGTAYLNGYLDDYAFLLDALITVMQIKWRNNDLHFAIELADVLLDQFYDNDGGGFYFTAHEHESLIYRAKPLMDTALPAGNGIAATCLLRLSHLLHEQRYLQAVEQTVQYVWPIVKKYPVAHHSLLDCIEEYLYPLQMLVLCGQEAELAKWQRKSLQYHHARRLIFTLPAPQDLPSVLAKHYPLTNPFNAYVCLGHRCLEPIREVAQLQNILTL